MKRFLEISAKLAKILYIVFFSLDIVAWLLYFYERIIKSDSEKSLLQKFNIPLDADKILHVGFFFFMTAVVFYHLCPKILDKLKSLNQEHKSEKKQDRSFLNVMLLVLSEIVYLATGVLIIFLLYEQCFGSGYAERLLQKFNPSLNLNHILILNFVLFALNLLFFDLRKKLFNDTEEDKEPRKSYIDDDEEE